VLPWDERARESNSAQRGLQIRGNNKAQEMGRCGCVFSIFVNRIEKGTFFKYNTLAIADYGFL
jgi:hypothetical protein